MSTGNLFNTKRFERAAFELYKNDIFSILERNNIEFFSPFYYVNKESFGDLDIVLKAPFSKDIIFKMFKIKESDYKCNSNVQSICYRDMQIDFIAISPDKYQMAIDYYSWADLSILLGRFFKKFNLTYGIDGLYYNYNSKIDGSYKNIGNIFISKDMKDILSFFGLSYSKFESGFKTKQDVFDYISSSALFNPAHFISTKISNNKNRSQIIYDDLVKYVSSQKKQYPSTDILSTEIITNMIDKHFVNVDFSNKLIRMTDKEKQIIANAEKFNGNIVMSLTSLKGKELGDFIVKFKEYAYKNYGFSDFDEYVFNTKAANITKDIVFYFRQEY